MKSVTFLFICLGSIHCDKEMAAGCFDFRLRTRSFDLHQIAQHHKLKKLGLLLRYGSDTDIKANPHSVSAESSSKNLPLQFPNDRHRRFVRVVRDARNPDLENPHVVHRFSQDYIEETFMERSNSISEGVKPLPYVVTGHTILKKQATVDKCELDQPDSPAGNKHAKFFDEVIVIEFDKKCTIRKDFHVTHREKLHDYSATGSVDDEIKRELMTMEMIVQPETCDSLKVTANGNDPDNEVFLANGIC